MTTVSDIFKEYGPEYVARFMSSIPKNHLKVIKSIIECRTEAMGQAFYLCESCNEIHSFFRSCGDRHCPACQNHKTILWTDKQIQKQLPGHYFLVTFTVPQEIRNFFRANQKISYSALFEASSQAMKKMLTQSKSRKDLSAGFWGVLHTWGRQLQYHPHIHYVVPGGKLCKETRLWKKSRKDFLFPVLGLSKIIRAKFKDIMKREGLLDKIPEIVWNMGWNVNCRPAGNGRNTVKYLSRYVFKIAISNSRIIRVEDRKVYFKYTKQRSTETRVTSLEVNEFIRRFLQHVLPSGFMKIRYFGFIHPAFTIKYEELKKIVEMALGEKLPPVEKQEFKGASCVTCGHRLKYIFSILPNRHIVSAQAGAP